MKLSGKIIAESIEVAVVQHKIVPHRATLALLLGGASVLTLGPAQAGWWTFIMLCCELWTWRATRPALSGNMTQFQIWNYLASGAATVPCWTALGVLYWLNPASGTAEIALVLWAAQLINTQRFIYQSVLAIGVGNSSTIAVMIILPLIAPRFEPIVQVLITFGIAVCIGFAISGALMTMKTMRSLSAQKAAMEYAATHDQLTQLKNRGFFQEQLASLLSNRRDCAVLFIDLDRFKRVNDTLGHQAGDELLKAFSKRLSKVTPSNAIVARFGGDEFAVLIDLSQEQQDLKQLSTDIIDCAGKPFELQVGQDWGVAQIGSSIGVALGPEHGANPSEMMRKADLALYSAKTNGRNLFKIYCSDVGQSAADRDNLEKDLRRALASEEGLAMHYQPRTDQHGQTIAVEGLLRWQHPTLGNIPPNRIINMAEETHLIQPLGDWVMRQCIEFAARWPELIVSINVSPLQLSSGDFAQSTVNTAETAGIKPEQIEIEITESVLLNETPETERNLEILRSAGFSIAIDDFGTGYSSLRLLHKLPVDRIKIDRSFVNDANNKHAAAIITAVTRLSHAVGIQVTAEGVETIEQKDYLCEVGVDELQGFLFAAAMPESDLHSYLKASDERRLKLAPGVYQQNPVSISSV